MTYYLSNPSKCSSIRYTYDNIAIIDINCDVCHAYDMISVMHERYKNRCDKRILCWLCYSKENMNKQYNFMKDKGWIK